MKEKAKEKVTNELQNFNYLDKLKENFEGFVLYKEMKENEDAFNIFLYENKEKHLKFWAYFHGETMEYKVEIAIGLINFCDVSFFSDNIEDFEKKLREQLEKRLLNLADEENKNLSSLIKEKGILEWKYESFLSEKIEDFCLFITPKTPKQTINGSYIIFDYSDFKIDTDFTVYYNIFRDEFFGESRIAGTPTVTYDFDSKTLKELEEKLKLNMINYLKEIAAKAKL